MKKLIAILIWLLALSACEVVIIEPYDPRDEISGTWQMEEYSETWNEEYVFPVTISKVSRDYETIRIHNFYDVGISVIAHLHGNKIEIPFQVVDFYEVSGIGTVYGDHIDFSYNVFDQISGGYRDHCHATAY